MSVHGMSTTPGGECVEGVQEYYDSFSSQLLYDYIYGNRRVERQQKFFLDAIPSAAKRILVIGCGLGDTAQLLAEAVGACVHGVDISRENVRMAEQLFGSPDITFAVADATADDLGGPWDVVCLPDVYEHIPVASRDAFARNLRAVIADGAMVLLTLPSVSHQEALMKSGRGLQIVDELVTMTDLQWLAEAVGGFISFYSRVSAFRSNDYAHVAIEIGADREDHPQLKNVMNRLKRNDIDKRLLPKIARRLKRISDRFSRARRKRLVASTLGAAAVASARRVL